MQKIEFMVVKFDRDDFDEDVWRAKWNIRPEVRDFFDVESASGALLFRPDLQTDDVLFLLEPMEGHVS